MIYRRFILLVFGVICVVLLPVCVVNYIGDAGGVFLKRESYEEQIAKSLLKKKNVEGVSNFDERLLQSYCLKSLPNQPKVFILGSSRVMSISRHFFPESSIFNLGVSGCSFEDILAFTSILDERQYLIGSEIIIGVDPWMLNRYNGQNRWKSIASPAMEMAKEIGFEIDSRSVSKISWNRVGQIVSGSYFLRSLKRIANERERGFKIREIDEEISELPLRKWDGSIGYEKQYRSLSLGEVERSAIDFALANPVYSLGNFNAIDVSILRGFKDLIIFLNRKGAHVHLVMMPYHPKTYELLSSSPKYNIINEVEKTMIQLSDDLAVPVSGSYNPKVSECLDEEFFDGMHPKEGCLKKVIRQVVKKEKAKRVSWAATRR
jgi:hypothetical protein